MASFEKRVDYIIDFEEPILEKYKKNSLVTFSGRALRDSVVMFNGYVRDSKTLNVVFISFKVGAKDKKWFKELTVSDVKNIIYNTVIRSVNY